MDEAKYPTGRITPEGPPAVSPVAVSTEGASGCLGPERGPGQLTQHPPQPAAWLSPAAAGVCHPFHWFHRGCWNEMAGKRAAGLRQGKKEGQDPVSPRAAISAAAAVFTQHSLLLTLCPSLIPLCCTMRKKESFRGHCSVVSKYDSCDKSAWAHLWSEGSARGTQLGE